MPKSIKSKDHFEEKLPPMRTSADVVNRVQHDEAIDEDLVTVGYLDRFLGVLEKKFSAFVWCKIEMASLLDLAIPKHRIEYFNYHGELVWSKKGRIDKVFGSSNSGGETIYDVIQRHADAVRKEKDCPELIVNEQESSEIRPSCKSKPRPTHFICIPISDPAVRARLHELQTQVCAKDSRLEQACIPVAALHITLLMLRCPNPEALAKAKSIFEEFRPLLNLYVPMSTSISLKGVNTFDGRVMYAQPIEVGRLRCLVDAMAAKFTAAGVRLLGNRTPYQPHVTLFKLSRAMSADAGVGRMDYTLYGKFSDKWIGEQAVNSLNFCELYGVKDRYTGFYVSISSIANSCSIAGASSVINVGSSINVKQLMEVIFSDSNAIQRVVVLRGLPGFGKSELARAIVVASNEYGGAVIASADDCMAAAVDKCGRTFDPTLLPLVHQSCYERAAASLSNGVPLVIIDNTNTQLKEYIVYEELAKKRMASFHVIEVDHAVQNCATGLAISSAKAILDVSLSRNVHAVPIEAILQMWERWEPDSRSIVVTRNEFFCKISDMLVGRELCWQYLGVVLDETSRQLLLSTYRPQFSDVRCHHVTLLHNNDCHFSALESMLCSHPLGSECTVTVYGEISDFQCHGAVVEITDDAEQQFASSGVHHLTISHDASVTPKYTASLLSQKQSSGAKYNIRSEPLLLRGVVSLCIRANGRSAPSSTYCLKHISDFLRVMASAGTQTIHSENNASIKINKLRYSRQLSQYSFHAIHSGIKRVLIFDFDDTLIYTPSTHDYLAVRKKAWHKPDASRGAGWYCSEDSLSCDLPMRAGPALNTLLDSAGGSSTCIIVLTGRHEGLSHLVKEVLAARGVLNHIDEVVCKPQRGQCTANFKADYVGALLECCPWVEAVSVWDDKIENLSKIKESFNSHQRLYLGISLPVLETSLIQLDEPATVFASGVEAWAESNGQMASKEHKIRTQFVIDEISYIWNAVLGEYINTSNFKSAYTFGSYDFERRSDLDILLVCPIILEFSRDCNWMKTLVGCLNNSSCHIEKQFYFGDSGNVPRMAARYIWSEGPSIDVDIIMLYCVNQELLVDGIDLKLAMSWSLKDMALMSSSIDLLPLATRKSLYGIAVKNTCLQCCEKYRIARRQFGCLISAARRVMDRCHCMGSSRTGMRPYLISLSMVAAIDIMASTISLDEILALWLRMHTKDCVGIPDAIAHLRQFYPVGTIPDCNLLRIHDSIQSLDKDFTNIMAKLNTIGLPSPWNYRTVRIRTSQKLDKCSSFVVENVIHGIISKYSARLTHSGYPVLSAAPDGVQCIEERKEKCVGHLGVSKYGVDAAEGLFPLIVRDFDNFMKSAAACKTLRKKISLALDLV